MNLRDELNDLVKKRDRIVESITKNSEDLYKRRKEILERMLRVQKGLKGSVCPDWCLDDVNDAINRVEDFRNATAFENDPKGYAEHFDPTGKTAGILAASGAVAGTAVGFGGPAAAMAIATLFGTASTGTAIGALSGAAATNAALAWLGGGAVAAGGAGIAGGTALISLFAPAGLVVGGAFLLTAGWKYYKQRKQEAEEISAIIPVLKEDVERLDKVHEQLHRLRWNVILWMNEDKVKEIWDVFKDPSQRDVINKWLDDNDNVNKLSNMISKAMYYINYRI